MLGKGTKASATKTNENRGFNSALYFNSNNYNLKKLEIETNNNKPKRKLGMDATPKSIDTPQSCASVIDLKKCIPKDVFNKIEESSPIKSTSSIAENLEIIAPDFDEFEESCDEIVINLQPTDMESNGIEESNDNAQKSMLPNTMSYFNVNNNNNFNKYNSHPQIGYTNMMPNMTHGFFSRTNNSEGDLLNYKMNNNNEVNNNVNNVNNDFSKLFKINDYKKEENSNPINNTTKDTNKPSGKNIIKKTINNQDIKGWTCVKCKNFNYEMRVKCNRCARKKSENDIEISQMEEKAKKASAKQNKKSNDKKTPPKNKERTGDWVCIKCKNNNFSFRVICNRCQIAKSESDKLFDLHMKNVIQIGQINENLQKQMLFKQQTMQQVYYNNNLYNNQLPKQNENLVYCSVPMYNVSLM